MLQQGTVALLTRLAGAVALLGCGLADPEQAPGSAEVDANEPGTSETIPASTIDGDTRVTLERTECFGSCPVYSVSVGGDGTVDYFGPAYVNVKGPASKQVPISAVEALVDRTPSCSCSWRVPGDVARVSHRGANVPSSHVPVGRGAVPARAAPC